MKKYQKYMDNQGSDEIKATAFTVRQVAEMMLEARKARVKATTYEYYQKEIAFLSGQPFGKMQISQITSRDIQRYIDSLADKKALKGIKNQKLTLNLTFEYAAENGYCKDGLMEKIQIPNEENIDKKTREPVFLTSDERRAIEAEADRKHKCGKPFYTGNAKHAIVFLLHTGLRISELIALTWDDVDFGNEKIHIGKNAPMIKKDGKYQPVVTTPKTKNSIRNVPLDDVAMGILKELHENRQSEYVFENAKGGMMHRRNITRTLDNIVEKSGISQKPSLHDLRHTFASELIRQGADIKTVSTVLGHASVSTTLNIYVHKSDDDLNMIKNLIN
jgi:integrase